MVPAIWMLLTCPLLMLRLSDAAGSFPRPLGPEEEAEYVRRCAAGEIEARNVLVERNLRLVAHIVKKYYAVTSDQDDLISIGTIGLIKGVSTYRPDRGVRLATYASRCIENGILMHFRSRKKSAGDVSLSEALESDREGGGLSILDVIRDDTDLAEALESGETVSRLRTYLARLDSRERRILALRYGLSGEVPMTQRETAAACGISRSYVSRIEKKALERLREWFREEDA